MLPVARSPITSQLSISVACSTGKTQIRDLTGVGHDRAGVNDLGVLDPGGKAPLATEQVAAVGRHRAARLGAGALVHPQAPSGKELLDRLVAEIGGIGTGGQRAGHQHPSGRGVAIGEVLDDLE